MVSQTLLDRPLSYGCCLLETAVDVGPSVFLGWLVRRMYFGDACHWLVHPLSFACVS